MASCHLISCLRASSDVSQQLPPVAFQSLPLASSSLPKGERTYNKDISMSFKAEGKSAGGERALVPEENEPGSGLDASPSSRAVARS